MDIIDFMQLSDYFMTNGFDALDIEEPDPHELPIDACPGFWTEIEPNAEALFLAGFLEFEDLLPEDQEQASDWIFGPARPALSLAA